jgi:hypothetical protein
MEDEVVVAPIEAPEVVATEPEPVVVPVVEDEKTSAFKELRNHNKELERALKEQGDLIRSMNERIPTKEEPRIETLIKPTLAMFYGDVDAFEIALEHYAETKQSIKVRETSKAEQAKNEAESNNKSVQNAEFETKILLARGALPDIDDALTRIRADAVGSGIDDTVVAGIMRSPASAELLHYLEAHRDETKRIESLTPQNQIGALRAIEAWIMRGGYKPVAKVATALDLSQEPTTETVRNPVPPRPTGGTGVTHTKTMDRAETTAEYLAAYRASMAQNKRR